MSKRKKEEKFRRMVEESVARAKQRRKDPNERKAFWEQYAQTLKVESNLPTTSNKVGTATGKSVFDSRWKNTYDHDPVLAEREADALKKAEQLKSRIGVAYNKGGYQVISERDVKDMGKKTSQMKDE